MKNKLFTRHLKIPRNSWTTNCWTRNLYCSRDAEANDMIHMGSDHRSVMAQIVMTAPQKEISKKKTLREDEDEKEMEHKEPN